MLLKREDHILEHAEILRDLGTVSPEVNIKTSARKLAIELAQRKQVVRSEQDVHRMRAIGQRLDDLQLVSESPARCNATEMLCFVNQNGCRASMKDCGFQGVAE